MEGLHEYREYLEKAESGGLKIKKGTPKNIVKAIKRVDLEYYKIYGDRLIKEGKGEK